MILPKERDPRFITVRRGGSLSDPDHHLLAIWAADCAEHVLHHFEQVRPGDDRPRRARGGAGTRAGRGGQAGVPLAARTVAGCDPRAGAGRPAAAQRAVLERVRLLSTLCA